MKRISPTSVEINLEALRFNYRQLKKRLPPGVKTLCVVKSNAYGHGAPQVSRVLQDEGADFFGTGTVDEGIELREAGIKRPILILLGLVGDDVESLLRYQLTPVLYDLETASRLNAFLTSRGRYLQVHVKIDTGMTRLGVLSREIGEFCDRLRKMPRLKPVGIMSHLADAGEDDFTRAQARLFGAACREFRQKFPGTGLCHLANSQAVILHNSGGRYRSPPRAPHLISTESPFTSEGNPPPFTGDSGSWMVRLGIALYGAYPLPRDRKLITLKPVLRWKTKIVLVKKVPSGTTVSYGRTFKTGKRSAIGVLPVGYADGYPRLLSNKSHVLVKGKKAPVIGMICMDMMMVDLTSVPSAARGDEVVLIGAQGKEEIRAEDLAARADTISYEIFCGISQRISRIY